MNTLSNILLFYGVFLVSCGITAVAFIGMKAKTALLSGGSAGMIALVIAYLASRGVDFAFYLGIGLTIFLFIIFSWRATKTLLLLLELTAEKHEDVKGKAIAFLIIALMAIITLMVFALLIIN